jgi:hypothetical protein
MAEDKKAPESTSGRIPQEAKDHFGKAKDEFKKGLDAMFPPEVREHRQEAQKEVLMGLRSLIDAALEKFEQD